jgi:hypothetical protein
LRAAAALAETRARQRAREDEQKHQKAIEDLQSLHQQEMQGLSLIILISLTLRCN